MNEQKLRQSLCDTGRVLVGKGLVARTWGNLSVRLDDHSFLITPSGRSYEGLTPAEIVRVSLEDLSYSGDIKPSSEKNLHQVIYKKFSDVGGIIHTHQPYASVLASSRKELPASHSGFGLLAGKAVPCAGYALPTTKSLAQSVEDVIGKFDTFAVFLANHGAVFWGESLDAALKIAEELEVVCLTYILEAYRVLSDNIHGDLDSLTEYYIKTRRKG